MPKDITYVLVYTSDGVQYKEGFDDLLIAYRRYEKIRQEANKGENANMKIIKEDLTGCINRIGTGAPKTRFLVIQEPINETGICKEFKTEEEAQEFIRKKQLY